MELADDMIPIWKERHTFHGVPPRYVSIKTVDVDYVHLGEVHQMNAVITYISDDDETWKQDIIIRYFDSIYYYNLEESQYHKLLSRTEFASNIKIVELLYKNKEEQILIYDRAHGVSLDDLGLKKDIYYYQFGALMAVLHGTETEKLNLNVTKELVNYLVNQLPFEKKFVDKFMKILKEHYRLFDHAYAAYEPLTTIELDLLSATPIHDVITKRDIMQEEAIYFEVLPSLVTDIQLDRMEDLANLVADDAIMEYRNTGEVSETLNNVISLLEGYEGYYEANTASPLDQLYPNGLSIDLHVVKGVLLEAYSSSDDLDEAHLNLLQSFCIYLLTERPFQFYGKS